MSDITSALRATLAAAVILVAGVAFPNVAAAQADSVITACYVPNSGSVYRIKTANTPQSCTKTAHVEFSWRKEAPSGLAGYKVYDYQFAAMANTKYDIPRGCLPGEVVVAGGVVAVDFGMENKLVVHASIPTWSGVNTGWRVVVTNTSASNMTVRVMLVCAKSPPGWGW